MPSDPTIDHAHLQALQAGDDTALNRLIARWEQPLLGFAFRYVQNRADARDLAAEAFVRLYQQRARLRPDTNLSAWLFTTLANLCSNHLRWKRRHPAVALEAEEPGGARPPAATLASGRAAPDAALQQDEVAEAVRRAIALLPHDLKTVLLLHHYQHLSCREIARIVHCSESGVESRLYRARQRLRGALADFLREISPC
ncbi:MAG TPA: sigma-70 family RNA polymerase sigma factor [Opitutaceae bacterium]|nr:sigma-70 family RNA polymerase sigma factor [Opitutaceae bacterium]